MSSTRNNRAALLLAPAISLLIGCGDPDDALRQKILRAAELPGALSSDLEPLRLEVLRIEEAGQTPKLLAPREPAPDENAAAILASALSDDARLRLVPKLSDLFPAGPFEFEPSELQRIREAVRGMHFIRQAIDRADAAPLCVFAIENELGYFAGMRFLDDAAIAAQVHVLSTAPLIAEGDIRSACDEVEAALRWAERLSRVDRIEARLLAGQLRGKALVVVEALAKNPKLQRADIERLYTMLRRALDAWPSDAASLLGDRAITMHTYELVRAGLFDNVVTTEERQTLKERRLLEPMQAMTASLIDADELAYLRAMGALIEAAEAHYHERAELIASALAPFDPDAARSAETPLATHLFLPGIDRAMKEMARDRSITEAWALALAAVGDIDLPPYKRNPLIGVEYEIDRLPGGLVVQTGDPELRAPYARALK